MPARLLRVLFGILLLLLAQTAMAQSNVGTTMGAFLKIEPSARNAAMGNTGAALTGSIESIYFNPAGIGSMNEVAVQFTHGFWFADIGIDYAAVSVPVRGWGTFFGSLTSLRSGEIDVRTVDEPLGTGERYSVSNVAIAVGYGRRITSRFVAGGKITFVNESIWNSSNHFATFTMGTTYRLSDSGIRLGSSLSNLGTRSSFTGRDLAILYDANTNTNGDNSNLPASQFTGSFSVPILFRIGLSVPYELSRRNTVLFLVDALHPSDNTESINAGAEWLLNESLALRAGYQTMFQDDSEFGWTFGFGLRRALGKSRIRFDYGWAGHDRLDQTHRVTVILAF